MNKLSVGVVLLSTLLLASCGGGGGGSDSPTDTGNPDTADTQIESTGVLGKPVILSISSGDADELDVNWNTSQYGDEIDSSVTYTVHIKKGSSDFVPDANTAHTKSINSADVKITGLEKNTEYTLKVVAQNNNEQSISNLYTAKTSDTDTVVKSGLKIHYQKDIKTNILDSMAFAVMNIDPSDGIKAGSILHDEESGFVLKVISIDSNNVAKFRQASIRDMYEQVSADTKVDLSN